MGEVNRTILGRNMSVIVTNQFLTALADSIYDVAIFWYVYDQTQSALYASILTTISMLTQILIGPFMGVVADRNHPKWTMQLGFVLMIAVGITMTIAYVTFLDYFVILLYIGVVIHEIGMTTILPAKSKLLPRIVSMDRIVQVNGYISSTSQIAVVLGKSISGFLISLVGFVGVMLSHSAIYLLACLLLQVLFLSSTTKREDAIQMAATEEVKRKFAFFNELKEALKIMRSHRTLFKLIMIGMVINLASVIGPLFIVVVREQYNGGAIVFGWFNAVGAIGGILVGLFAKRLLNWFKPVHTFTGSMIAGGVSISLVGMLTNVYMGMALYFSLSFCLTIFNVAFSSLLITLVEDEYRGRIQNLTMSIAAIFIPIIAIIGGYVADLTSAGLVYIVAGIWVVLGGCYVFFDRDVRTIEEI
ncbi:hypothetical protein N781_17490 [Pontibacillus halophilus JSM 076056 = DSM 19796]|uniref:MFS transporter n=1 Tax=Pontibacillus halophilus JSM 076056 = DSM 19796 TaxID=1385510 RepID=A0A0A5I8V5_9BACI|nr:MFS transporter [Pontibacillus halophilus]KGX92272.1 hypothetical protein N781_17490 [Pontibacillus halophilus JSM 076056 = DSM 19796]